MESDKRFIDTIKGLKTSTVVSGTSKFISILWKLSVFLVSLYCAGMAISLLFFTSYPFRFSSIDTQGWAFVAVCALFLLCMYELKTFKVSNKIRKFFLN